MTNEELYGTMMRATVKIQERRMWFNDDTIRQVGTPLSKLMLLELTHGCASRGQPALTYIEVLKSDAGVTDTEELTACMKEKADGSPSNPEVFRPDDDMMMKPSGDMN